MSDALVTVTVTPGNTALVLSVTVPLMAPAVEPTVCATATDTRTPVSPSTPMAVRIT